MSISRRAFQSAVPAVLFTACDRFNSSDGRDGATSESTIPLGDKSTPHIKSAVRRDDTILRQDASGDCWHMTWANDDRQYAGLCDGYGVLSDSTPAMFNSRLFAIEGGPYDATFQNLPGYPDLSPPATEHVPRYYNFGTLALDGHIYQFLSTANHDFALPDLRFIGTKLIYSPDNGATWRNQNGSTPVVWEGWNDRSRETMAFFNEEQGAFAMVSILQMGKNYQDNRDGYVYIYAPNGFVDGTMNELVLARVPKARLLERSAYEYCTGVGSAGAATWTRDITERKPVHTFPRGWVNTRVHPYAWLPSVVYNAPLGLYMMTSWGIGVGADGAWFDKPSYLGFWSAPEPWGPWTQFHEETSWLPGNDPGARTFQPQIAPKWIAADGRSFWLVWSDFHIVEPETYAEAAKEFREKSAQNLMTPRDHRRRAELLRKHMPNYTFNMQRVDLVL